MKNLVGQDLVILTFDTAFENLIRLSRCQYSYSKKA